MKNGTSLVGHLPLQCRMLTVNNRLRENKACGLPHIGFVICKQFLKVSFIIFTIFMTYFHVCDFEQQKMMLEAKKRLNFDA